MDQLELRGAIDERLAQSRSRDDHHLAGGDFLAALLNARISRDTEPGCRQFDVCVDPADKASVFLYEIYDDRGAFDAHLAAAHFKRFDAAVGPMVASKAVRLLNLVR